MNIKEINPKIAQENLKEGAIMVDVREADEVNELAYDVDDLLHIPLSEFEKRFKEIPQDKNIIMACRSGARSQNASTFLMSHGYSAIFNLRGGIIEWTAEGFPTK